MECHNPTQKYVGNDIGSQYRSAIYYTNENKKKLYFQVKKNIKKNLIKNFGLIETEIKMIDLLLWEQYHQQYLAVDGNRQYCSASPTKVKLGFFEGSNTTK